MLAAHPATRHAAPANGRRHRWRRIHSAATDRPTHPRNSDESGHQFRRQVQKLHGAPVADRHDAFVVDHDQALIHVLQRRFQQPRLLRPAPFAVAKSRRGLLQKQVLIRKLSKLAAEQAKQDQTTRPADRRSQAQPHSRLIDHPANTRSYPSHTSRPAPTMAITMAAVQASRSPPGRRNAIAPAIPCRKGNTAGHACGSRRLNDGINLSDSSQKSPHRPARKRNPHSGSHSVPSLL